MTTAPKSLRIWFFIHFLADYIAAVPIFLFPEKVLALFGWTMMDPLATRLVAAALLAIGGASLISKNSDIKVYKSLLNLKIIWSGSAIMGIILTAFLSGGSIFIWAVLAIFAFFAAIWIYYRSALAG